MKKAESEGMLFYSFGVIKLQIRVNIPYENIIQNSFFW